jgi:autophagy-related protein 16
MGTGEGSKVYIWNIHKGMLIRTLKGHEGKVFAGDFVPNGDNASTKVVTGGYDRTIKTWDLNVGTCEKTYLCLSAVNDLHITRNNICLSAHADQQIRIYDLRTQRQASTIPTTHTLPVSSVTAFDNNPDMILTNSRDNTLRIIDIRMCKELQTFSHERYANPTKHNKASVRPCGSVITVGSSNRSGTITNGHVGVIAWDLQVSDEKSRCKLIDVATNPSPNRFGKNLLGIFSKAPEDVHVVSGVSWSTDGTMMAVAVDTDFCIMHT